MQQQARNLSKLEEFMLYASSHTSAREHGGSIMKRITVALKKDYIYARTIREIVSESNGAFLSPEAYYASKCIFTPYYQFLYGGTYRRNLKRVKRKWVDIWLRQQPFRRYVIANPDLRPGM